MTVTETPPRDGQTPREAPPGATRDSVGSPWHRAGALAGVLLLTWSYLSVLYGVTDVVGGVEQLLAIAAGTFVLATALGRTLSLRTALAITAALLVAGVATYLLAIPRSQLAILSADRLVADTVALLTGLSILRLTAAGTWAVAVAPGPVFLSWYLAVRGRYAGSVAIGAVALLTFVLTGDAGTVTTIVGAAGALAAIGLGTIERHGGSIVQLDALAMVLAAAVVLSMTVSVVPGGGASPLMPDRGAPTADTNIVQSDDTVEVLGSIRLSPRVRFTVESDRGEYWQTAAYDRYTGSGWVRTGNAEPYPGPLSGPPGDSRVLEQSVTPNTGMTALPAAWKPVRIDGNLSETTEVTPQGTLRPARPVESGERYTVVSRVPEYTTENLRGAGTDYPAVVEENYLQLPESTPDRVREQADAIAGDEPSAYDKAVAIEEWLESNKRYSLSVEQPDGEVADAFLFEMDAGYCVYYATTMVTLLRAEGVPARFVSGYTAGEEADDGTHVVRGLDSHAWVQVYFPDTGWVRFDPTPAEPRRSAEQARIAEARQNDAEGVDTELTESNDTPTPTDTPESATPTTTADAGTDGDEGTPTPTESTTPTAATTPGAPRSDGGGWTPTLPSRRTLGVGLVALVGVAAGAHRTGAPRRFARWLGTVRQSAGGDPDRDVERAFHRLERVLERAYRPRRSGETPRQYVNALARDGADSRVRAVGRAYERAHYGGGVTREEADRVVGVVDDLVRESLLGLRRPRERPPPE